MFYRKINVVYATMHGEAAFSACNRTLFINAGEDQMVIVYSESDMDYTAMFWGIFWVLIYHPMTRKLLSIVHRLGDVF